MKIKKNRRQLQAAVAQLSQGAMGFEKQVQDFIIAASNEIHRLHNTLRLVSISQEALVTALENKGVVKAEDIQAISKTIVEKQIKDAEAQEQARKDLIAQENPVATPAVEVPTDLHPALAPIVEAVKEAAAAE